MTNHVFAHINCGFVRLTQIFVFFVFLALGAMASQAVAKSDDGLYVEDGIALAGYDPVAYFTMEEAVQGSDQYTVEYEGAVWRFASQEHADLFLREPEKYQPKYGGFCAFGVAKGYRMKPDMTAWEIHDGQLYLYFDTDVADVWAADRPGNEAAANAKWAPPPEKAEE